MKMLHTYIISHILLHLPFEECIEKKSVCRAFLECVRSNHWWKKKFKIDLPIYKDTYKENKHKIDVNWERLYINYEAKCPYSINNVSKWKNYNVLPFGCGIESCATDYIKRSISEENFARIRFYFKKGLNSVITDNHRIYLLEWCICKKNKQSFTLLSDHFVPQNKIMWQHVANYILESQKYINYNKSNFEIYDVINLIKKSEKQPIFFVYHSLGSISSLNDVLEFYMYYPEIECIIFQGIGKNKNYSLFTQYIRAFGNLSELAVRQTLFGSIIQGNLHFIVYLRSLYPHMVTPETILYLCCLPTQLPRLEIVEYALLTSKDKGYLENLCKLIDIVLLSYSITNSYRQNIDDLIQLALDWGYEDYQNIVDKTKKQNKIYYNRFKHLLKQ